jgi:multidrug efflux pump subunit AcrA (membrane-fusion protein)
VIQLLVVDQLYAVFNIPVEDIVDLDAGDPVVVTFRSDQTTVKSQVNSIPPAIDGESGTVPVRVTLDNSDRTMRSGDRCTLQILSEKGRRAAIRERTTARPKIPGGMLPTWGKIRVR